MFANLSVQSNADKQEKVGQLALDGAPIESLGLYFTLPGYDAIELKAGGESIKVTAFNLDEYIQVRARAGRFCLNLC